MPLPHRHVRGEAPTRRRWPAASRASKVSRRRDWRARDRMGGCRRRTCSPNSRSWPESASAAAPTSNAKALLHFAWLRQGHGMPVIMLHGFGGELGAMRGILSGGHGDWPALALDLPCHGQSPRTTPHDLDAIAEMVEATLAAQRVGPIVLAGHSFGGAVAVRLAHRAQMEVRGLCLFAPAGLGPEINGPFVEGISGHGARRACAPGWSCSSTIRRASPTASFAPWRSREGTKRSPPRCRRSPDASIRTAHRRSRSGRSWRVCPTLSGWSTAGRTASCHSPPLAPCRAMSRCMHWMPVDTCPISNIRRWPCASSTRSGAVPEDELRPASPPGHAAGCRRSPACQA